MKMTATEMGFYKGARIRRGQAFDFDPADGNPPRWAVPEGTPLPPLAEPHPVDTKPADAIAAVQGKTGMRSGAPSAYDMKPADAQKIVAGKMRYPDGF